MPNLSCPLWIFFSICIGSKFMCYVTCFSFSSVQPDWNDRSSAGERPGSFSASTWHALVLNKMNSPWFLYSSNLWQLNWRTSLTKKRKWDEIRGLGLRKLEKDKGLHFLQGSQHSHHCCISMHFHQKSLCHGDAATRKPLARRELSQPFRGCEACLVVTGRL